MRKLSIIAWLGAMLLTGCGGSNTLSGSTTPGATSSTVTSITVTSSATSIASDGSDSATITAVAKDANNNFVQGVTIAFSSTTGGGLAVTQATTDTNGAAIAKLSAAPGTAAGTAITVTASNNGVSGTTVVNVVNTQQTLTLSTSAPQIPSNNSKSATITALVRGSNNQFLSGVTVNFTATSGGLAITQAVTDVNGAATATLNAASDPTNRTITVTATAGTSSATIPVDVTGTKLSISGPQNLVQGGQAGTYTVSLTDSGNIGIPNASVVITSSLGNPIATSPAVTDSTGTATVKYTATTAGTETLTAKVLGLTATQTVSISNQSFVITAPAANAKINLGASQLVTVVWTAGGVAQTGKTVSFSSTRGTLTSATAVTDGSGTATVSISSTTAGPAIITANASGVSTQTSVDFLATQPASIDLQATPATIPTQGQSTLTAIVRDAQDNLVEGQTVSFQLTDNTGGVLSVGTAITDVQGKAQTVYTASSTPSATNGVVVTASIGGSAATPGTATLTVGGQSVFLSLGTGNTITPLNDAQYSIKFAVTAIDGAGNGVSGANIILTMTSLTYVKGLRIQGTTNWVTQANATCASEDINNNGILDAGEDINGDGKLWPGSVASVTPGTAVTDSTGSAIVTIVYPKDHAYYVTVRLTATTKVAGTETDASADFLLPGALPDFALTVGPPGPVSPYGIASSCANPL